MPPTNAIRSSMTIVFSWWQWSGRSCASSATCIARVGRRAGRASRRTSRGRAERAAAARRPSASTRTSIRSASSASRSRSTSGSPSRSRANDGVKYQPARWTCERRVCISAAIAGSASAPSISTSTALPGRGGGVGRRPAAGRRVEGPFPADPAQPPLVVSADLPAHLGPEPALRPRRSGRAAAGRAASPRCWRGMTVHRLALRRGLPRAAVGRVRPVLPSARGAGLERPARRPRRRRRTGAGDRRRRCRRARTTPSRERAPRSRPSASARRGAHGSRRPRPRSRPRRRPATARAARGRRRPRSSAAAA